MRVRDLVCFIGLLLGMAPASARCAETVALPPSVPSFLDPMPSRIVIDLAEPGLQSFSIHGRASDPDRADILSVTLNYGAFPNYVKLIYTPGNPVSFEVRADGLSYANLYETYPIGIQVFDNSPYMLSAGWRTEVFIFPEPSSALSLFLITFFTCARRRLRAQR
jgi:hypothetical protein